MKPIYGSGGDALKTSPKLKRYLSKGCEQLGLFPDLLGTKFEESGPRRNDVQTGNAGELVAQAALQCWGLNVMQSDQGSAYDLLCEVADSFVKIQVKSTTSTATTLNFKFTRGFHGSNRGVFEYDQGDFDIAATVSIADRKVLFSAGVEKSISWKHTQFNQHGSELRSWNTAIAKVLQLNISEAA